MKTLIVSIVALLLVGCASFSTNMFRAEQSAVNVVYAAYVGYTNGLAWGSIKVTSDESNAVKVARLKFAATVSVTDTLRQTYNTNSAVKPQLSAAIDSLNDQASNIVWLVNYLKGK